MIEIMLAYIFRKLNNPGDGSGDGDGSGGGSGIEIDPEKLMASDAPSANYFGWSVANSKDGSTIVIGAHGDDNKGNESGSAYVFIKQPDGSYLETQKLLASDGSGGDGFGYSVSISQDGSTIVIGAHRDDDKGNDSGSVYVFTKQSNGSYLETHKLVPSDGEVQDYFGYSVSVSQDGSTIIAGALYDDDKGASSGSAYIFTKQINGSYLQSQKLLASDGVAADLFGNSVSVSADSSTIVVGSYRDDDKGGESGSVYVFTKQASGSYLQAQKLVAIDGATYDYFGYSVSISQDGSTIVVGAYQDSEIKGGISPGSAYIFIKQANGSYLQAQKLVAIDGVTGDQFGYSVAITGDGSTVVVGARYDDDKGSQSGSAYIFTKQANGSYLQTQKLVVSDGKATDRFGWSVAISNTSVVIGAPYHLNKGAAYIFGRLNNPGDGTGDEPELEFDPIKRQKISPLYGQVNDKFGGSVTVSADGVIIVVGCTDHGSKGPGTGAAYIFRRQTDGKYSEIRLLVASDGVAGDYFGSGVSISGDSSTIVIGANADDDKGVDSGSIYIFTKQANGTYLQTQKLVASDGVAGDNFGVRVALSKDGSTIIVSARYDDDKGSQSGSAYIFTKQANGSYLETQKLLADDGVAGDNFGISVSISGDNSTIVIGASNVDDNGIDSGAAYIFTKEVDGSYFETHKLLASNGAAGANFGVSTVISKNGSIIIVGSPYYDDILGTNSGSAYIFTKQEDGSYLETHKLRPFNNGSNALFGTSLAISNTSLVIGAAGYTVKGSAYVF